MTWPLSSVKAMIPRLARLRGRHAVRIAWWAATPWQLPRRVKKRRDRRRDGFDPYDGAVEAALGLPRLAVLWPPQQPSHVKDRWAAARWVIDLLRARPELRVRFPHALSEGGTGAFAAWLTAGGARQLGLPEAVDALLLSLFATDLSARPRQLYFARDDLRVAFALGLLPAGSRALMAWLLRHGSAEEQLRREEVWWFALCCAENPAAELVRTYSFTPEWQRAHPCGLTRFGRHAFAVWLGRRHDLPPSTAWLDPEGWPTHLSPVVEIRLAYAAHEAWRGAHPQAFETPDTARALLRWLAEPSAGLSPESRAWCRARAADATAAALATPGANVIGHFCYASGLRVSAEAISHAMAAVGMPVVQRNIRTDRNDEPRHKEFDGLETHDVTVIHTQPEPFFDHVFKMSDLAPRSPATYRVAYWYWEMATVPAHWAGQASRVDEIWAATGFVADALRKTVAVPVYVLFPGVRIGPFLPRSRAAFGLPDGARRFAFLFSFHMASVMERKNPLGLIRAFRQAFRPDEPVDLILKTTSVGRHARQLHALHMAADGVCIHIVDRVMTPDETLSLIDACDAYVSLHRSEGLGLTLAEAMLLGKPVIATGYSGNLDFMDPGNSLLVDYKLVPVGSANPPYDAAAQWAEPSWEQAARLMRRVYDNRAWAADLGATARREALIRCSLDTAGARFAARLAAIKASTRQEGVAP